MTLQLLRITLGLKHQYGVTGFGQTRGNRPAPSTRTNDDIVVLRNFLLHRSDLGKTSNDRTRGLCAARKADQQSKPSGSKRLEIFQQSIHPLLIVCKHLAAVDPAVMTGV